MSGIFLPESVFFTVEHYFPQLSIIFNIFHVHQVLPARGEVKNNLVNYFARPKHITNNDYNN